MKASYNRPDYMGGGIVSFSVSENDNCLFIVSDGIRTKSMNVKEDSGSYVFKLNKRSIAAIDGAIGLFNFVNKNLHDGFMEVYSWKILSHVLNYGK